MKLKLCSLIVCMLVLEVSTMGSQNQPQQAQQYQVIADRFFSLLQQGKSDEAIDYAFGTNPRLKTMSDQVDQLKSQFRSMEQIMGPYMSSSKLAETKVAGMFIYQHYFVAYERQPISVRLKFYKPANVWMVYAVQFDANLSDAIEKETDEHLYSQFK